MLRQTSHRVTRPIRGRASSPSPAHVDLLPDDRKMVVVVLCREVEMIYQPHRLLQSWVQHRSRERLGRQRADAIQQVGSGSAKLGEDVVDVARVVVRVVRLAVAQVGGGQRVAAVEEVLHARAPQRLEIEEVTGVLLRGPLVAGLADEHVARDVPHDLLQPRGRPAQADAQIRTILDRKGELELSVEPGRDIAHPFSLVSASESMPTMKSGREDLNLRPPCAQGTRCIYPEPTLSITDCPANPDPA